MKLATRITMNTGRFLLGVLLTVAVWPPDVAQPRPPSNLMPGIRNVLLIVADDMGIDRSRQYLGLTGNAAAALPPTPTIRQLQQSGVTFDNAWANPVCSPTRAGFLTGRHSFRTTVADVILSGPGLPAAEITLPELIAGANYVSGLFGKWHLGGGPMGPNNQGFDEHRGTIEGELNDYAAWQKYVNGTRYDANPATPAIDLTTQYATEANVQDAYDWIQQQTSHWLAVVAFNAPHTPLHTPTNACDGVALGAPDINRMIECMDQQIGWLLTQLAAIGELESTTVIFIGDNGTDRASILGPFDASPNPSYKANVYEGGIRIPFIVADGYHYQHGTAAPMASGTGRITNPGRREDAMVHTVDIFATVADIVGVAAAAEDSRSMIPYLESATAADQRQYVYTDRCSSSLFQAAIRDNQYKLIYRLDYTVSPLDPIQELYAVTDLAESNDLYLTGLGVEQALWTERNSLWSSAGFNPLAGCP